MLVVGQALSTDAEVKKESIVLTRVSLEEPKEGTPPPKSTTISFSVRTAAVNFDDAEISRSQPEAGNFPIATVSTELSYLLNQFVLLSFNAAAVISLLVEIALFS